jgi:hypothetical protein
MEKKPITWITKNGKHIPIYDEPSVDEKKKEREIAGNEEQADEKNNLENAIDKIKNQEYQYHATTGIAVWSIYENGLKPGRGHAGKGVYFAPSAEDALEWTATSSTGGTTLLRVKTKTLKEKYEWGVLDETESTADKKISRKDIEIKKGSEWVSLEDFKKSRETSYKMWKARR